MHTAGLDIHKSVVQAAVLNEAGELIHSSRFAATREALEQFGRQHLGPNCRVALEATFNTWTIAEILQPLVAEVVVSNPLRTRAIAEAKIKTDRIDARVLAQLLRAGYLPRVWQPDTETRRLRQQTTERASIVSDRTRLKNRVHSVLHQRLIAPPTGDLFAPKGRSWLKQLNLDPAGRRALDSYLRQLDLLDQEQKQLQQLLAQQGYRDPRVKLLMTLPGVDVTVAMAVIATLGDVTRFPNADRAAAYLGLVPSTRQSADHCYHGPITKQGRSHARWLLVQAAHHLGTHPGPLGVFFRRLLKRKNRNVAVVATARKLIRIAWHMLRHNEPYRYAQPRATETKLSRLRVQASGLRKRGGVSQNTPRPDHYGQKLGRIVPSLDAVYDAELLPALAPLSPGESRMIAENHLTKFVTQLRHTTRTKAREAD